MGLMDPDKEISQCVRNFCSSSQSLPTGTLNRACSILDILFPSSLPLSSSIEFLNRTKFLAIATNILLEMTSHSPDFIKPLFQNHLDCQVVFETLTASHISSQASRSLLPGFVKDNSDVTIRSVSHDEMFKIPKSVNIPKKTVNFDWIKSASTLLCRNQDSSQIVSDGNYSMEWGSSQIPGVEMSMSLQSQTSYLSLSKPTSEKPSKKVEVVYIIYVNLDNRGQKSRVIAKHSDKIGRV